MWLFNPVTQHVPRCFGKAEAEQMRWEEEKKTGDSRCRTGAHNMFRPLSLCRTDSDISIWSGQSLSGLLQKGHVGDTDSLTETRVCKLISMQIKVLGLTGGFPWLEYRLSCLNLVGRPWHWILRMSVVICRLVEWFHLLKAGNHAVSTHKHAAPLYTSLRRQAHC